MSTSVSSVAAASLRRLPVDQDTLRTWLQVATVELAALVVYFAVTDVSPIGDLRYLLYPFVWINVGLWAVAQVDITAGSRLHRGLAAGLAGGYLLVVMAVPGTVGLGTPGTPLDLRVAMHAPGWGPVVAVASPWVRLYLVPFEVIGYLSLAYLVYANVLVVTRGALSGVLGLATCVGCTVPVIAPLVGLLGGGATGLASTAYAWSYDLGTLLFVLTVGLLHWSYRLARR